MKKIFILFLSLTIIFSFSACITEDDLQNKYNEGYTAGYDKGYDKGYKDGRHEGYKSGYDIGYDDANKSSDDTSDDDNEKSSYTVYVTTYGKKYHSAGCGSLWSSCHEINIDDAISKGYEPCERCNP